MGPKGGGIYPAGRFRIVPSAKNDCNKGDELGVQTICKWRFIFIVYTHTIHGTGIFAIIYHKLKHGLFLGAIGKWRFIRAYRNLPLDIQS